MKKTILTLITFSIINALFAQSSTLCRSVISCSGGSSVGGTQTFEFTLGEPLIETYTNPDQSVTITQGFNQPEVCLTTAVPDISIANPMGMKVFPNPTADHLQIQFETPQGKLFDLQVFNALGHQVLSSFQMDIFQTHSIDCRSFPSGAYFLLIRSDEQQEWTQVPFMKAY